MDNKRFVKVYTQSNGLSGSTEVIVDLQTGVNYLFHLNGYGGGLTPLLDKDGKPIVTPIENK
ncbi:MAG: xylan 1,4-beta-xylosidase [Oscillospiraceae bacterium]|nr:xylan 1,4-beta-xylosidase [Oscillospiraceae bacterium]